MHRRTGIDSYIGTWRGVYAKKGTLQEAMNALAAIEEASKDQRWVDFLVQGAYDERVGFEIPQVCPHSWKKSM